ncbi:MULTISPECIES: phage tail tube protein [unclassified Neptuniibacter]|uniref:phage tail tube protein n=1 Tax=unclassified Neptuniibacter TaxID=2630693 RepID=UPI000C4733C6|nr:MULTISPECIES: phage tail tube protein [unclassified Neptuniibacter]MAY42385.1 hypothetical protein [Oceanospirillaceae bacterium]|tara:strand:- start:11830 stop:12255 length:426 start_codon:yes stop_codon:yes gene_type:complete
MSFGNGTRFVRGDDSDPQVMVDIGGAIVELGSFAPSKEVRDDNRYSDDTNWKKKTGGMRDGGQSTFKMEFDRSEGYHTDLQADFNSDDPRKFGFNWPDAAKTQVESDAIVSGFEITHEVGEKIYANVTLDWSGEPVWGNWT